LAGVTIWGGALAAGVWLRYRDHREIVTVEAIRREERLELARELHDVVAHHVTGILVQAQAARFTAAQHPEAATEALAAIETAGGETLTALRRLVGLLRDPGDAAAHGTLEPLDQLVTRLSALAAPVQLHAPAGLDAAAWPPEGRQHRLPRHPGGTDQHRPARAGHDHHRGHHHPHRPARDHRGDRRRPRPSAPGAKRRVRADRHARTRRGTRRPPALRPSSPHRLGDQFQPAHTGNPTPVTIRVLLADDQAMVRTGFRLILESQPDITVVAEASNGPDAIAAAREHQPDVALVDIRMPGLDGIEVTRTLAGPDNPNPPRIVIVTTFDTDEYVHGALRAGAVGFLLKDAGPALLIEAVRAAHTGDTLISPSVTVRLLQQLMPTLKPATDEIGAPLSERERQIAGSIARGRTNQEIAAEWFISLSTVKTHITRIQDKLGVRNRVEIAAWAWENRLVEPT